MYISKISFTTPFAWAQFDNLAKLHSFVESFYRFEYEKDHGKTRKRHLWRVEKDPNLGTVIIVLSENKPRLSFKNSKIANVKTQRFDKVLRSVKQGYKYDFKIVINPTKRSQGKVSEYADPRDWLLQRQEANGFKLIDTYSIDERQLSFRHKFQSRADLRSAVVRGQLEVTNLDLFKKALVNGIGREKAYGFGMLALTGTTRKA